MAFFEKRCPDTTVDLRCLIYVSVETRRPVRDSLYLTEDDRTRLFLFRLKVSPSLLPNQERSVDWGNGINVEDSL